MTALILYTDVAIWFYTNWSHGSPNLKYGDMLQLNNVHKNIFKNKMKITCTV
jgi:hypothetical protein